MSEFTLNNIETIRLDNIRGQLKELREGSIVSSAIKWSICQATGLTAAELSDFISHDEIDYEKYQALLNFQLY